MMLMQKKWVNGDSWPRSRGGRGKVVPAEASPVGGAPRPKFGSFCPSYRRGEWPRIDKMKT
jgi:hypothetical protein